MVIVYTVRLLKEFYIHYFNTLTTVYFTQQTIKVKFAWKIQIHQVENKLSYSK